MAPRRLQARRRITAASVIDPRGAANSLPQRGSGSRPWDLYRQVPELRSGVEWLANAVSRAHLYVVEKTPDGPVRVTDPAITGILDELFGTGPGQADMLKRIIFHLEVAGETFLVPYLPDGQRSPTWVVASAQELRSGAGSIEVQVDVNTWAPVIGERMLRIWHPDPVYAWKAESPIVAMESVLHAIIAITSRTTAINESRLAGNGLLGIPDTLTIQAIDGEGNPNTIDRPDFPAALEEAMVEPMRDRGLASSVVPIIFTGPQDGIDGIRHISLASPLDDKAEAQLEQGLRRMAISMALPPEIILGLGDTNHWNSFAIIREAVETSIEPRLDTVTGAFTTGLLRPRLERAGYDPSRYEIAADLSDLVVPPDRSEPAERARQQGLLTDEAWAGYLGFEKSDMPTGQEKERILLERVLFANPDSAPWILPKLGITLPGYTLTGPAPQTPSPEESPAVTAPSGDGTTQPIGEDPGDPGVPKEKISASVDVETALLDTVEAVVLGALSHAGAHLAKAAGIDPAQVPVDQIHTVIPMTEDLKKAALDGACGPWADSTPGAVPLVTAYLGALFDDQTPHSRDLLRETLTRVGEQLPEAA
ncbi:hypothetical protein ABT282_30965 [Streptomyces sp. NPDC000927]|uniref:hypothetical protein n=1 Tax=Streptomyces sp. NPDC000927 TaxID=3154371 RepID=UPI00331E2E22